MTNLRQDRVPDQTLSPHSAPGGQAASLDGKPVSPRAFVLAVRIYTIDSSGRPASVSWKSASPAVDLSLDLIRASGGVPDPAADAHLFSSFFNLQSALLTARRLRWALEGLGGSEHASMLIHSVEDPGAVVSAALENVAPGQILLGKSIAESVYQLPNLSLREVAGGWLELAWKSPSAPANPDAEEQSVLRMVRELGREDPCAHTPQSFTTGAPPAIAGANLPLPAAETLDYSSATRSFSGPTADKKKWLVVGGAAAAVILLGAILIPVLVSGNHAKTALQSPVPQKNPEPAVKETNPAATSNQLPATDQNPTQSKPPSSKSAHASSIGSGTKQTQTDQSVPARAYGKCDLTEADISRSLDRAETDLHAGRLTEAQSEYARLQGCPSAHERAAAGLRLVKQRIDAGSSGP